MAFAAPADLGAERDGGALDWRDAVAYAGRAHGSRKRPSTGWDSLTPTEERVVALVVDGLTNPQIADKLLMGRATVKTPLEHVYAKLGIRTRTELAAAAARRGTADDLGRRSTRSSADRKAIAELLRSACRGTIDDERPWPRQPPDLPSSPGP